MSLLNRSGRIGLMKSNWQNRTEEIELAESDLMNNAEKKPDR